MSDRSVNRLHQHKLNVIVLVLFILLVILMFVLEL